MHICTYIEIVRLTQLSPSFSPEGLAWQRTYVHCLRTLNIILLLLLLSFPMSRRLAQGVEILLLLQAQKCYGLQFPKRIRPCKPFRSCDSDLKVFSWLISELE